MSRRYPITLVDDDALPAGQDFMLIILPKGITAVFLKRSAMATEEQTLEVLSATWLAYRLSLGLPPQSPTVPPPTAVRAFFARLVA